MGNYLLDQKHKAWSEGVRAGLEIGLQIGCDMDVLCLRDPDVMGKDTFGAARVIKFIESKRAKMKLYEKAWEKDPEADYLQEKLDDNLREAFGGQLEYKFAERYPDIVKENYRKARKR